MGKYFGLVVLFSVHTLIVKAQLASLTFNTWTTGSTDITRTVGSCSMRTQVAGSLFQNSTPRYDDAGASFNPTNGTGLHISNNWVNTTTSTTVTFTFTPAIVNPTFSIFDINRSSACNTFCSSAFADRVVINTNNGTVSAAAVQAAEQTISGSGTATVAVTGNSVCNAVPGAVNFTVSGSPTVITITYSSGATVDRMSGAPTPNTCGTGGQANCNSFRSACADPTTQFITIGSISGSNSCASSLPIELVEFNVVCTENSTQLSWVTDSEQNNDYFNIERSSDGLNFETIKEVSGSGSTNFSSSYSVIDDRPLGGLSYYRLSQTDYDGSNEVLGVLSTEWPCAKLSNGLQLFPNPTDGDVNLVIAHDYRGNYVVEIFDAIGKLVIPVIDEKFEVQGGTMLKVKTSDLSSGIFLIKVVVGDKVYTEKLVIKK